MLPHEQERSSIAPNRERWKARQHRIDPRRPVFLHRTWIKRNKTRVRGCCRGKPLKVKVPYGHWKTLTFLAGLRCDRIDAPWVLDGPINGASFEAWIETQLVLSLKLGDIVILHNLSSHKNVRAKER